MNILLIDIDTLRPDHLGCYGYHRATSPAIDAIAAEGVRFEHCHASDVPCLPSRSALISGRFGIANGAVNHGGLAADPFPDGAGRGFRTRLDRESFAACLRRAGLHTCTISTFAERHSAWQWYAGFNEVHNVGGGGLERAEEVAPVALDWLERNARRDGWFLHVHLWDPHTPYRAPAAYGDPFADSPLPAWYGEEVRQRHWQGCGPHSAREVRGFDEEPWQDRFPRQPRAIASLADARALFDGYDTGVRYADDHVARLVDRLKALGRWQDTAVIVTSDHGENLGELNIYGDHQTADEITTRIPMIVRWPGLTTAPGQARVDHGLHYHLDLAATVAGLLGQEVPRGWDGRGFADDFRAGREAGRDHLVLSQLAWSCQRAVRTRDHLCIRTYHDGYHGFPAVMLFAPGEDPHQQRDLAPTRPDLVAAHLALLDTWHAQAMQRSGQAVDPLWTVMREGGPFHTRGRLPAYLARLRGDGRGACADLLAANHPAEAAGRT